MLANMLANTTEDSQRVLDFPIMKIITVCAEIQLTKQIFCCNAAW